MSLLGRRLFQTTRMYSTTRQIVPPKIATPNVVGGAQLPPYLQWITDLYARMPKGAAAKKEASGFWARYRQKYMHGDSASFAPVVHLYIAMVLFGYTYQYHSHLKHHKSVEHH